MANHSSTIKAIRKNKVKRLRNRYQHKSMRTAIKKLKLEVDKKTDHKDLMTLYSRVSSMIDKSAKKNIIHKNKAARIKSRLHKRINFIDKKEEVN